MSPRKTKKLILKYHAKGSYYTISEIRYLAKKAFKITQKKRIDGKYGEFDLMRESNRTKCEKCSMCGGCGR